MGELNLRHFGEMGDLKDHIRGMRRNGAYGCMFAGVQIAGNLDVECSLSLRELLRVSDRDSGCFACSLPELLGMPLFSFCRIRLRFFSYCGCVAIGVVRLPNRYHHSGERANACNPSAEIAKLVSSPVDVVRYRND